LTEEMQVRVPKPPIPFYGKDILEMSIATLLKGENLLLSGGKATGKNILAENLSYIFGRPSYNISFHVNVDSAALVGTDTFIDNEVRLRKGMVTLCAENGGFGVFDEINMAKNDAVSVLHAALDYRGIIDIPGYDRIELHPATRFIGTMNYGYAGTKELNEALVSRFMVINMPKQDEETVSLILKTYFPEIKDHALKQFVGLFMDLQLKAEHSEISTKSVDIRGMIGALKTIQTGLMPTAAVNMGITNKSFDIFEREIVEDIVMTRIPEDWTRESVF
ncbi:MAG: MoxR family ATPase, partial [Lachnospiraceae bacterium]|nr:MoxR family ATPase [Lachnospiraceae bacterium]